jgi:uncharacterized membrane protein
MPHGVVEERPIMPTIRKSIEIKRPVDEVYTFMTTPENMLLIMPSLVEAKNAKRSEDGANSFDWTYKMAGVHFHGHAESTEVERGRRLVMRSDKGIANNFRWTFQGSDDSTQVAVEIDYEIPGVLGKLAQPLLRKLNEREAELMLSNAKAHLEEGARREAPQPQP